VGDEARQQQHTVTGSVTVSVTAPQVREEQTSIPAKRAADAGLFIVSDDEEERAQLPSGAQDLALVIQDRTFDSENSSSTPRATRWPGRWTT
jgi:hypothetical protein